MVTVDDFRAFTTPIPEPVPVEAGLHDISARKEGFEPLNVQLLVVAGETKAVDLALVPHEAAVQPGPQAGGGASEPQTSVVATGNSGPAEKPEARKPLTGIWVALGAGGGLAALAGVSGGLTLRYRDDMLAAARSCEDTTTASSCPAAYDLEDKASGWKIATNVLWGAAAAAVVAGLVFFIVDKPVEGKPEATPGDPGKVALEVFPIIETGEAGSLLGLGAWVAF